MNMDIDQRRCNGQRGHNKYVSDLKLHIEVDGF
jgi:hypothetical protein